MVVQKRFHKNYRIRDTGEGLVEAVLGAPPIGREIEQTIRHGVVQARLSLGSLAYRPYQQLQLAATLTIEPGWHVYAIPVPEGYTPLTLEVTPVQGLEVGKVTWPDPHPFRIEGLEDQFFVLEGTVRSTVPLTFAFSPGAGTQTVRAVIRYQACSTTECLPPGEVRFELLVPELPRIA
ncbi:MAG TPA: protein-disulfide reductase DsbD N-terminal domain-containing protein [Candidatus Acidoferrales bacterium]|nr:protein-disulfide reductase DsbD N-terminal domain-containing protein [Candidatus Acidoferrales bacterium]